MPLREWLIANGAPLAEAIRPLLQSITEGGQNREPGRWTARLDGPIRLGVPEGGDNRGRARPNRPRPALVVAKLLGGYG